MKPEEIHAHVARIHDDMARAMGHRPDDQQHRAWIEHDWLRGVEPGSGDWDRALRYLGLAELPLDDPAVPEALRGLLAPPVGDSTEGRAAAVGVGVGALAGLAIGAAQGGLGGALMGT
ncbi:MAG TPA: hypothetical protein PKA64_05075, partial [Myxococcota bacterium]|nr:hypothetical protein [Myxococcota bacterium]